jgi:hypothetical protein
MVSVGGLGIWIEALGHRVCLHWIGFVLPCLIAIAYVTALRDRVDRRHWMVWGVATVATLVLTTRVDPAGRGILIAPLYFAAAALLHAAPALAKPLAYRPMPASVVSALTFVSMAIADILAGLVLVPPGRSLVLGGGNANDMLVRTPMQVALIWFCIQIVLAARYRRVRRGPPPGLGELVSFNFFLRPRLRPQPVRA